MLMKNSIAVIVLMSFVTWNPIQGEMVHGINIPEVNMAAIRGTWYMAGSTLLRDSVTCNTFNVEEKSEGEYTIEIVSKPKKQIGSPKWSFGTHNVTLETYFKPLSNIIFTRDDRGDGPCIIILDMVPDSYIAAYQTLSEQEIDNGRDGIFFLFTRDRAQSHAIFERVSESKYYVPKMKRRSELIYIDGSSCT